MLPRHTPHFVSEQGPACPVLCHTLGQQDNLTRVPCWCHALGPYNLQIQELCDFLLAKLSSHRYSVTAIENGSSLYVVKQGYEISH